MRDQNLTTRKAGSTTAETAYSSVIDTGAPDGIGNIQGKAELFLSIPTVTGLASTKTQTFTVQSSPDNSTWTDVAGYSSVVVTGNGSNVGPAVDTYFPWLPSLPRYLRVKCVTVASPGTITAYNYDFGVQLGRQAGV